jgi:hypothetical protein
MAGCHSLKTFPDWDCEIPGSRKRNRVKPQRENPAKGTQSLGFFGNVLRFMPPNSEIPVKFADNREFWSFRQAKFCEQHKPPHEPQTSTFGRRGGLCPFRGDAGQRSVKFPDNAPAIAAPEHAVRREWPRNAAGFSGYLGGTEKPDH